MSDDQGAVSQAWAARRLRASSTLRRLAAAWPGGKLLLTGGSLRDRLLGLPTHDLDLVTEHDAERCAADLARSLGGRCFRLGQAPLVTWRVVAHPLQLDLWEMSGTLEEDARRRDFTINAVYWQLPDGPLIDLVDGLDDLAARRLRVVRERNLKEDPLRVLRGVRLLATHATLSLAPGAETQLAGAAAGLVTVARERVLGELRLTLAGPEVERALLCAQRRELLLPILPGWTRDADLGAVIHVAGRLAAASRQRGTLGISSATVAPAVLAAPAAGLGRQWQTASAIRVLTEVGVGSSSARRVATAVKSGERLAPLLDGPLRSLRVATVSSEPDPPLAIAWALARRAAAGGDYVAEARRLLTWYGRFKSRKPLLSGQEVAHLLELPPDARRAAAVRALRLAQAGGAVRTAKQATRWLLDRANALTPSACQ